MKHSFVKAPSSRLLNDLVAVPVSDVLGVAYTAADWSEMRALFTQHHQIRVGRPVPDDLRDVLAQCLSALAASYCGAEQAFVQHAFAVIADVVGAEVLDGTLFRSLYRDRRWGPGLLEHVAETVRRRRDLDEMRSLLAGTGTSGIPCGSISYGPFYNVHGPNSGLAASDLDILLVTKDWGTLEELADQLSRLRGVDQSSARSLRTRAAVFCDQYATGMTVFSHKLDMWAEAPDPILVHAGLPANYRISLHVLSERTFSYVLMASSTTLSRETAGTRRTVRDYRDTHTTRPDRSRTFAGREHQVKAPPVPVKLGWLRSVSVSQFDDADCYCPGFYQTILVPRFEPRWDDLDLGQGMRAFERKYMDRFRHEQARSPHTRLRPSLTHVRREAFAPHVVAEFDRRAR